MRQTSLLLVAALAACSTSSGSGVDASAGDTSAPPDVTTVADVTSPLDVTTVADITSPLDVTTVTDVTSPPDVTSPLDVTTVTDITSPPDITTVTDITSPPDITTVTDITSPPDVTTVTDITSPPDVTTVADVATAPDVIDVPVAQDVPLTCDGGAVACGGACVNVRIDRDHCGRCGRRCCPGLQCWEGRCMPFDCPAGISVCDAPSMPGLTCGFDQTCVNLASDARNCGTCGTSCGSGQLCLDGSCVGRTADGSFLPPVRPGAAGAMDIVATGLGGVQGLALSADAQTAYVSATGNGVIWRVPLQSLPATPVRWAEGLSGPSQLTWDPMGALVVAEREGNRVTRITLNGDGSAGARTTLPHAFQGPWGVIYDASGNLLVSNEFGTTVDRVTPAGEVTRGVVPSFPAPLDLRYDLAGNLYVGDYGNPLTSGVNVFVHDRALARARTVSGLRGPIGLALDRAGDLYVANYRGNNVVRVSAAGAQTEYATGLSGPHAIAFDPRGRLYVADYGNQRLVRFNLR